MSTGKSKKSKEQVAISPHALKFSAAIKKLIELGKIKDQTAFSESIGVDDTTISRVCSGNRQLRLEHILNACHIYNLNANHFVHNDPNLFKDDSKKTEGDTITNNGDKNPVSFSYGENSKVIQVIDGNHYEQIAETIYNESPPELHGKIDTLVNVTRDIKKMAVDYENENGHLKQKLEEKEGELKKVAVKLEKKEEEVSSMKDKIIELFDELHQKKSK